MIFVFWELVGFSSYMLIGIIWTREEAAAVFEEGLSSSSTGCGEASVFLVGIVFA